MLYQYVCSAVAIKLTHGLELAIKLKGGLRRAFPEAGALAQAYDHLEEEFDRRNFQAVVRDNI